MDVRKLDFENQSFKVIILDDWINLDQINKPLGLWRTGRDHVEDIFEE